MSPAIYRCLVLGGIGGVISGIASLFMALYCQHEAVTDLDNLYGLACAVLFVLMVGLPSDSSSDSESNNR